MEIFARKYAATTPMRTEYSIIVKTISKISSSSENGTTMLPVMKISIITIIIPNVIQKAAPLG